MCGKGSLRWDGLHLSRLPNSLKKPLVISAPQTGIVGSFVGEVNAWVRLCPIFLQGKGTQISAQGAARSQLSPWAKATPCPELGAALVAWQGHPTSAWRCQTPSSNSRAWTVDATTKHRRKPQLGPKFEMGAEVEQGRIWEWDSKQDKRIIWIIHTFCSVQEVPSFGALAESCLPSGCVWKSEQREGKASVHVAPCNIEHFNTRGKLQSTLHWNKIKN